MAALFLRTVTMLCCCYDVTASTCRYFTSDNANIFKHAHKCQSWWQSIASFRLKVHLLIAVTQYWHLVSGDRCRIWWGIFQIMQITRVYFKPELNLYFSLFHSFSPNVNKLIYYKTAVLCHIVLKRCGSHFMTLSTVIWKYLKKKSKWTGNKWNHLTSPPITLMRFKDKWWKSLIKCTIITEMHRTTQSDADFHALGRVCSQQQTKTL